MIATRISKTRLVLAAGGLALLISLGLVARFAKHRSAAAFGLLPVVPPITKISPGFDNFRAREMASPDGRHRLLGCFNGEFDRDFALAQNWTPLLLATLTQDWKHARELSHQPAAVDAADVSGVTPLMIAAAHGNTDTLHDLLAAFANPNAVDHLGRTPLEYAITGGQPTAVQMLLPLTSTGERRDPTGADLDDLALGTHNWDVVAPVLEHFPPSQVWSGPALEMLNLAAAAQDVPHGRLLVARHLGPPTLPGHATPLLAQAIVAGDKPFVTALLAFGVNANTVVPAPCEKAFLAAIKSNYLRPYVEADSGITMLMLAAGLGDTDLVETLLAAGADRNRMTAKYKMLPLYFSTRMPSWRSTQILLGSGAPPEALRIDISLGTQHASVLKNGAPILTASCSTGRQGFSTPAGSYVITDKDRDHRSTIYKVPMPYFMRLNCRDFGLHEGNVGSPHASHGCIRLPGEIARKLFSEIPIGTVVNIN